MGAGTGSNSILITNYTNSKIDIIFSIQDSAVTDDNHKKVVSIDSKDSHLFYTDKVESLSWGKK